MDNTVEKLVNEMLREINGHILSWFGVYSIGPMYKILDSVWEWSGIRTRFESKINAQIAEEIKQALKGGERKE